MYWVVQKPSNSIANFHDTLETCSRFDCGRGQYVQNSTQHPETLGDRKSPLRQRAALTSTQYSRDAIYLASIKIPLKNSCSRIVIRITTKICC